MADTILGNLVWLIKGDKTDFDKNIKASENGLKRFRDTANRIGNELTLKVTAPLTALGVAGVKAASDLGESLNAVNVVFRDSAETIREWGEGSAEAVGLSQSAFNEIATVIGAQLKQSGLEIDEVADQTINLTERAADLASVFNTSVTDAAGALGAALRGESEPARRFALNISDAAAQAEALASGLVKSKSEITDQIKVRARLNLIFKQSADVAGDFQNTSDSLANSSRILKARLEDIAAEFGQALLPIIEDAIEVVGAIAEGFAALDPASKRAVLAIGAIVAAIGPLAKILAFASGPAGWITLAVAGISALGIAIGEATSEARALKKATEDVARATNNLNNNVDELAKEYVELAAREDLSNEEKERQLELANELKDLIPDLTTDQLNNKEAVLGAARAYQELNKQVLQNALAVYQERLINVQNELSGARAETKAYIEGITGLEASVADVDAQLLKTSVATFGTFLQEEKELIRVTDELKLQIEDADASIADIDVKLQEYTASTLGATDALDKQAEGTRETQEVSREYYQQLSEWGARYVQDENFIAVEINKLRVQQAKDSIAIEEERQERFRVLALEWLEDQKAQQQDLINQYQQTANALVGTFGPALEQLGVALVESGDAWDDLGKIAVRAIANVIRSLGEQAAIQAAIAFATLDIGRGIALTAASAAAFVAAGVVSSLGDRPQPQTVRPPTSASNVQASAPQSARSAPGGGAREVTIIQNNTLNTDTQENLERAARVLFPVLEEEKVRVGNG